MLLVWLSESHDRATIIIIRNREKLYEWGWETLPPLFYLVNFSHFTYRFMKWLRILDVLIVDRGFRDVKEFLEKVGLSVYFPSFLKKGEKQLEDEEANKSRLVTKVRWVVEVVNARLKTWAFLANVVPLACLDYLSDYILIIAALCNK